MNQPIPDQPFTVTSILKGIYQWNYEKNGVDEIVLYSEFQQDNADNFNFIAPDKELTRKGLDATLLNKATALHMVIAEGAKRGYFDYEEMINDTKERMREYATDATIAPTENKVIIFSDPIPPPCEDSLRRFKIEIRFDLDFVFSYSHEASKVIQMRIDVTGKGCNCNHIERTPEGFFNKAATELVYRMLLRAIACDCWEGEQLGLAPAAFLNGFAMGKVLQMRDGQEYDVKDPSDIQR